MKELLPYIAGCAVTLFGWLSSIIVILLADRELTLAFQQKLLVQDTERAQPSAYLPVSHLLRDQLTKTALLNRIAKSVDIVVTGASGLSLVLTFLFGRAELSFAHSLLVMLILLLALAACVWLATMSTYRFQTATRLGFSIVDAGMLLLYILAGAVAAIVP